MYIPPTPTHPLPFTPGRLDIIDSGVDCDSVELGVGSSSSAKHGKPLQHLFSGGRVLPKSGITPDCPQTIGSMLGLSSGSETEVSFVPVELLLTGSKVSVIFFDQRKIEKVSKSAKLSAPQRCRAEKRVRKWSRDALEVVSTESEASPKKRNTASFSTPGSGAVILEAKEEVCEVLSNQPPEDGYDGSEELSVGGLEESSASPPPSLSQSKEGVASPSPCEPHHLLPLLSVCVSQPHLFLTVHPQWQTLKLSAFDFTLKGAPSGFVVKGQSVCSFSIWNQLTFVQLKVNELS